MLTEQIFDKVKELYSKKLSNVITNFNDLFDNNYCTNMINNPNIILDPIRIRGEDSYNKDYQVQINFNDIEIKLSSLSNIDATIHILIHSDFQITGFCLLKKLENSTKSDRNNTRCLSTKYEFIEDNRAVFYDIKAGSYCLVFDTISQNNINIDLYNNEYFFSIDKNGIERG